MTLEKEILKWVKEDLVVKQFCEDKQNNNLFADRIIGLTMTKTQSKIIERIDKRIEELENKIKQAKEQLEFREIPYPHVVLKGHEDSTGSSEFVEEFITEEQIRIKELQSLKKSLLESGIYGIELTEAIRKQDRESSVENKPKEFPVGINSHKGCSKPENSKGEKV